jgi:serine/threonine protein kinase
MLMAIEIMEEPNQDPSAKTKSTQGQHADSDWRHADDTEHDVSARHTSPDTKDPSQPPAPPSIEELQTAIPGLEVLEFISQGGMGSVFKAKQKNLDRLVALKVVPSSGENSHVAHPDRFLREARTLAKLSHPNIVPVFDVGRTDQFIYLIMEFIEGDNLRGLMRRSALSIQSVLRIISQTCNALEYAHTKHVVHRDIKPENILINREGIVKIVDFGLAKINEGTQRESNLTGTRQIMGTPNYMSPEQIECTREVDHRSDIYSLGVVFYELLTGELPIGHFEPPSAIRGNHEPLDPVVLKALQKRPEQRYQKVSELDTDLSSLPEMETPRKTPPVIHSHDAEQPTIKIASSSHVGRPNPITFLKAFAARENWGRLVGLILMLFSEQWFFNTGGIVPWLGLMLTVRLAATQYVRLWPNNERSARVIVGAAWISGTAFVNWPPMAEAAIIVTGILWTTRPPKQKQAIEL